jgi:hypothetical protein
MGGQRSDFRRPNVVIRRAQALWPRNHIAAAIPTPALPKDRRSPCRRRCCSSRSPSAPSPRATASWSPQCASTAPPTASATTGTSRTWAPRPPAAPASSWPRPPMSPPSAASRRAASAHTNLQHQTLLARLAAVIVKCGSVPGIQTRPRRPQSLLPGALGGRQAHPAAGWRLGPTRAQRDTHGSRARSIRTLCPAAEIAGIAGPVRRLGPHGARGRVQGGGAALGARLPVAFLPLADLQPPQRRLWRRSDRAHRGS